MVGAEDKASSRQRAIEQKTYESLKALENDVLYKRAIEQMDSYGPELRSFIKEKDKQWTLLTEPPHLNLVGQRVWRKDQETGESHEVLELVKYTELEQWGRSLTEGYKRFDNHVNPVKEWHRWLGKPVKKYADFLPGVSDSGDVLNKWLGWRFPPVKNDSSIEPMNMHLFEVVAGGDEKNYKLVIKFFAHMVQRPMERNAVALVLRGLPGCGKGVTGEYFGQLFKPYFFPAGTLDSVLGNFNNLMDNMLFVYVDNTVWNYEKKVSERLKTLISENRIIINDKFVRITQPRNSIHFCFASNDLEGSSLPIEVGDRRFLVLDASSKYIGKREEYFIPLLNRSNTREAYCGWMHKLMNEPISDSDFAVLPSTAGRVQQMLLQRNSVVQWVVEWLLIGELEIDVDGYFNSEVLWPEQAIEVPKNTLFERYYDYWERNKVKFIRLGETGPLKAAFGKIMHELNPAILYKNKQYGRQQMYRGKNTYMFPVLPLDEYEACVARYLGAARAEVFQR